MIVYIIAVAGGVGSLVGAFFGVRLIALLWSTPLICLLYGALVLVAPFVSANPEAPEWARLAVAQLSDLALLIPVLVAGAAGTIISSSLTRQVQQSQSQALVDRHDGAGQRLLRPAPRKASAALKARTEDLTRTRPPRSPPPLAPLPVYQVDYDAPAMPDPPSVPEEPVAPRPVARAPQDNRRRQGRRRSLLAGELLFDDGACLGCTIQDLSVGGARVRVSTAWPEGRLLTVLDLTNGLLHEAHVRWRAGPVAGVRFSASRHLQQPGALAAAEQPGTLQRDDVRPSTVG